MKWYSALSRDGDLVAAARAVADEVRDALDGVEPNLALLFVSEEHAERYREASALLSSEFSTALLLGCTARSVIGGADEAEEGPGLSVTVASLPGVTLRPFHLDAGELPDPREAHAFWPEKLGAATSESPGFVILSDPFSFDVDGFIHGLDAAFPQSVKVGGVASAGRAPGENALYIGTDVHRGGAVGVAFCGEIEIETVVSQGCRPIGQPMFVTRARENILFELDGRPALPALEGLVESLSEEDQALAQGSLFLGIGMDENQGHFKMGDFIVRNLVGTDKASGALVVGGLLRANQVVQFQLRDAYTAAEDLDLRLTEIAEGGVQAEAALLFSCLGRGAHLYGRPNHDSDALRSHLGALPIGGFFANGEIGPVGGKTFVHGYTSVIALIRAPRS